MILVDANLLLYAYHPRSEQHEASKAWLESTLSGTELVRFAWLTLWAFLRISTNPRAFEHPLTSTEAEAAVATWLSQPQVGIVEPGDRHWDILQGLMQKGQTVGPLVMDAVLAAIALEHGAILYTTDRDFSRFPGLKWTNPLIPK
ncbi:MAG: type II toxin-antitoxin system VapC family toxin [Nitrospira sp. LK70]|nr:type II toxin-antitoxin system VapC family toxin [Nitrospira sp. LK70]